MNLLIIYEKFLYNNLNKNFLFVYSIKQSIKTIYMETFTKNNASYNAQRGFAESIHDSAKDILGAQCNTTSDILRSQERYQNSIKDKLDKKHNEITNIVYKLGDENLRVTNVKGMKMETAIEKTAAANDVAVERVGKNNRELVRKQSSENNDLIQDHHNSAMNNHKNSQLEIQKMENDVSKDAVENNSKLQIANAKSEGDIMLSASENNAEISLQELQNKQKLEIQAYKDKMDFSSEAADCCCEIKEHTTVKERETQLVAKEVDVRRMRDELALANTENLLLRFM